MFFLGGLGFASVTIPLSPHLEDHPMTDVTVSGENNHGDRFRPLFLGLWDPFQMAEIYGLSMGVILTICKLWDDPPSSLK